MAVSLDDLREHVGEGPSDDELQRVLDAALEQLANRYGPDSDSYTEYVTPYGQWVDLGRRASEISSVIEGTDTLDPALYALWRGEGDDRVRRLDDDEQPTRWRGMVEITYVPLSETATRDRLTIELCDLYLNSAEQAGLTGITVGPWSEQYGGAESVRKDEAAIVSSLRSPRRPSIW